MDLSDKEILQKLKEGDQSVFNQIFRDNYVTLVSYSRKFIRDKEEAEEVVQELFVNFWKKRASIEVNTSLKSYLFRSVHNMCINQIKRKKVKDKFEEYYIRNGSVFSADFSNIIDEQELQRKISKALEEMPEKVRVTFQLIRFEDMKYKEAAGKLGISVKTVEAQMGIALRHMRLFLKEYITLLFLWYFSIF
jgi:RNA polymerase sigma-70 factor, ECF subfamily